MSEAAKVRDLPQVMKYITGRVADVGAGHDKITPDAIAFDGRPLEGIDHVTTEMAYIGNNEFDAVFSSHFLEHVQDDFTTLLGWAVALKKGGHLVLYLPNDGDYNNESNPEHMRKYHYLDFIFFFKRCFCGEGKNFKGEHLHKYFEIIGHGIDKGEDRYSFFLIAKRV